MDNLGMIVQCYEQAKIEIRKGNSEIAKSLFLQSWESFYHSDVTFIPDDYIKIANKALECYRELSGLDDNEFDNIVYGC